MNKITYNERGIVKQDAQGNRLLTADNFDPRETMKQSFVKSEEKSAFDGETVGESPTKTDRKTMQALANRI